MAQSIYFGLRRISAVADSANTNLRHAKRNIGQLPCQEEIFKVPPVFAIRRYRALKEIHRESISLSAGLRARYNEAGAYDNPIATDKLSEFFRLVRSKHKVLGQYRMLRVLQHRTDPMMRSALISASPRQQHVAQIESITENAEYEIAAILKMWESWLLVLSVAFSSLSGIAWACYVLFRMPLR